MHCCTLCGRIRKVGHLSSKLTRCSDLCVLHGPSTLDLSHLRCWFQALLSYCLSSPSGSCSMLDSTMHQINHYPVDTRAQNNAHCLAKITICLDKLSVCQSLIFDSTHKYETKKKKHFQTIMFQEDKHLFCYIVFLLVRLVGSRYHHIIFNILTSQ